VKEGWEAQSIASFAKTGAGGTPKKSTKAFYEGGNIPWLLTGEVANANIVEAKNSITPEGLKGSSAKLFPANSVLVAMYGATAGQVGILRFEAATNQAVCAILPSDQHIPEYLYYYLLHAKPSLVAQAVGNAQPNISQAKIKSLEIPLPPLEEQQRIVAVLDEAFEGLARARAHTEANLQNARELFERQLGEYFSDTPKEWLSRKLKQITSKIGSGATPRGGAGAYKNEGISLIRSLNVHDRWFKEDKLAFIDDEQADKLSNVVIDERDVLLNITGASIARCCVAPSGFLPARVNQHVQIIRPDHDVLSPEFLTLMLTSQPYKDGLLKTGEDNGSTRQALTKALIQNLEVAFPPELVQQEAAVATLEAAETKSKELAEAYQAKIHDLDDLRQSLLQKAFAGELT
jgi:type I restriction enzyme S subunit